MELAVCHQALAQTHKCLNNFPLALHHFEQFHELDKKLYQEQADRHVHQLQIVHQTRTIQQEVELYKQKRKSWTPTPAPSPTISNNPLPPSWGMPSCSRKSLPTYLKMACCMVP